MEAFKDSVFEECFDDLDDGFLKVFYNQIAPKCIKLSNDLNVSTGYMIKVEFQDKVGFYLYGLATLPEYRNQGRMTKLLSNAEEIARQNGGKFLLLATKSCKAEKLYKDNGFEILPITSISEDFGEFCNFKPISLEEYLSLTKNKVRFNSEIRTELLNSIDSSIFCYSDDNGQFIVDNEGLVLDYYPKTTLFKTVVKKFNQDYKFFDDEYSIMVKFLYNKFDVEFIDFILY